MVTLEEADRAVFEKDLNVLEKAFKKAFTDPEDLQALDELVSEWKHFGPRNLRRLSPEPWNMVYCLTLASTIFNRVKINELQNRIQ